MAAYVTLPTGVVIKYNDANWIKWSGGTGFYAKLFRGDPDKPGHAFIASVPDGAVVSYHNPCEVRCHAITPVKSLEDMVGILSECVDRVTGWSNQRKLLALKQRLQKFNGKTGSWNS